MLPEECLSLIISFTSPLDACRAALLCHALRSAADSDAVWERFLPRDYEEIISRSSSPSLLSFPKKDLYVHLCFHPILIENGAMSFQLEKKTGKKCYMLGARTLSVTWGESPLNYWTWPSHPASRFSEVAELKEVWWLDVRGKMERRILSSGTNYAAYLVFMLDRNRMGFNRSVGLNVIGEGGVRNVFLDPPEDVPQHQLANERGDGWMEIEMGEFFNERGDDGALNFCLREVDTSYYKQGLIIEGIEVRQKDIGR